MDDIKIYVIGENASGHSLAALMAAYQGIETHEPIDFVVGSEMARKIERRIIEPHEKPSKMYNQLRCGMFPEMLYCEPLPEDKEPTPTIPLPMSYRTDKGKYTPTMNSKKHLATCAKNKKNRKRKNR
jgi:hypothetical protein